jgi:hypothetical protein
MNLNYKHLGMYLLAGIVSGLLCGLITHFVGFGNFPYYAGPGLVLGIMIFLAGRFISSIAPRNTWLSSLILVLACAIGWFLAYQFGYAYKAEGFSLFGSGAIGGIFVAIGLTLAWKLNRIWLVIVLTVLAGILGVYMWLVGVEFFELFAIDADLDLIPLFVSWQAILFLAIGIAVQIDSTKPSTDS